MRKGLRGARRFAAVRAGGSRASVGCLRVQVATNGLEVARLGYATPGVKSAVRRNRARRRLRAAIRPRQAALAGLDVILSGTPRAAVVSFAELEADLRRCIAVLAGGGVVPAVLTGCHEHHPDPS